MSWFTAACYFRSRYEHSTGKLPIYEESVILIEAESIEDAQLEATRLANEKQIAYENVFGEMVTWEFTGLTLVEEVMGELRHGSELLSRFLRATTYKALSTEPNARQVIKGLDR